MLHQKAAHAVSREYMNSPYFSIPACFLQCMNRPLSVISCSIDKFGSHHTARNLICFSLSAAISVCKYRAVVFMLLCLINC